MISEPEWTAENINRKKSDTTFKQCGWCEHASCGSARYNCYLETSCSLLKTYGVGSKVKWDTPCVVKKLGKKDIEQVIDYHIRDIESKKKGIENDRNKIDTLKEMTFENKPILPENPRSFDNGSIVYVYFKNKWNRGVVVPGYRSGDGCVSYVLDDYPDSQKGWGCGVSVPCIIKEWEYNYFKENHADFKTWLELSDKKYNGEKLDVDSYYNALVKGEL